MASQTESDAREPNRFDARVSGRVQGVGFRAFVVRKGRGLNLAGFVRNNNDGTVDVRAYGAPRDLDALQSYLSSGPAASRVDNIEIRWSVDDDPPDGFGVQR